MAIAPERVREIFRGLETGDGAGFFRHVADNVDWTVMGTHPLAGHYRSKQAFIEGTFAKLNRVLSRGAELYVEHLLVKDDRPRVRPLPMAPQAILLADLWQARRLGPSVGAPNSSLRGAPASAWWGAK